MSHKNMIKYKSVINIMFLIVMLSVSVLSLGIMEHGTTTGQEHFGFNSELPCADQADVVSCLSVHLGVFQTIPISFNQFIIILLIGTTAWFLAKRKCDEPDNWLQLRFRWKNFPTSLKVFLNKIGQWLTLHEKRDPTPSMLVVSGILPLSIM